MKQKLNLFFFLLTGLTSVYGQDMIIAKKDSVRSQILGEMRNLWIHLPEGYNEQSQYPVFYLLDGGGNLHAAAGVMRQLGGTLAPPMIIVGIPNTDRERDMTPYPPVDESPFSDVGPPSETAGGGKHFVDFLEKELIPYIDAQYATADYRIISGHSLSGLLALYAGLFNPQTFNACIAVDPSIWWAKGRLIEEVTDDLRFAGNRIYIGIANTLEGDSKFETVLQDTTYPGNKHIQRILKLADRLEQGGFDDLEFKSRYYPDEVHVSAPLITMYDGVRYIFEGYPDPEPDFMTFLSDPIALQKDMEAKYMEATKKFGFPVSPPQGLVNYMGYECMRMEKMEAAEKYFLMNVRFYPQSQNVYDSLGDCYLSMGEKDKAIAQFKKALEIEERPHTREKLEKLIKEE
jgi:predicted alpha/beta superfamily hydrolase